MEKYYEMKQNKMSVQTILRTSEKIYWINSYGNILEIGAVLILGAL